MKSNSLLSANLKIKDEMLCTFNKNELKNKRLFDSLEKELPVEILYNIYTFCDLDERRQLREYIIRKHNIVFLIVISILSIVMYAIGYFITNQLFGIFIILNFLLGYLIISAVTTILVVVGLPFNMFNESSRL